MITIWVILIANMTGTAKDDKLPLFLWAGALMACLVIEFIFWFTIIKTIAGQA